MNSSAPGKRLFVLRARLARGLTLQAIVGLVTCLSLLLLLLGGAAYALACTWVEITAGHPFASGLWSLTAVSLALCAVVCCEVVFSVAPRPDGVRLRREDAEALFGVLDSMAQALDIVPVQEVFISGEMNAHIHQRPAWGVVGPLRTRLTLGLPLAHSLSPVQFAAVLAHELAHLAAQRRGWSGVAGALRAWWARTLDRASAHFVLIADWLDSTSLAYCLSMLRLSRIEEFEADALAARLVGSRLMGEALVEVSLKSHFLENDYWPHVEAGNTSPADPSLRPYRDMALGVEAGFMRTLSNHAVAIEAAVVDSFAFHPSLQRRLNALRVPCRVPEANPMSAAVHFLEQVLPGLAQAFDRAWWSASLESRRLRYEMLHDA